VFVSVTVTVTLVPAGTSPLGTTLSRCRLVDVVRPVVEPAACSPADGAGLPNWSMPWPSAVQALGPAAATKVQVKVVEAPAARVEGSEERRVGQAPPPVSRTAVRLVVAATVSGIVTVRVLSVGTSPIGTTRATCG